MKRKPIMKTSYFRHWKLLREQITKENSIALVRFTNFTTYAKSNHGRQPYSIVISVTSYCNHGQVDLAVRPLFVQLVLCIKIEKHVHLHKNSETCSSAE